MNTYRHACLIALAVFATTGCNDSARDATSQSSSTTNQTAAATGLASETGIVTVSEGTNLALALSPNGERLAISLQGVLFTLPVTGGVATAVTDVYHDAREPDWSADGTQIAFQGYRNGNWDLWQVAADGGIPSALTQDAFDDREPQYSPDGSKIAFSSDRAGSYDIWLLSLADASLQQITRDPGNEHSPTWSPDGNRLAYAVDLGRNSSEIRVADLASDSPQVVAAEPAIISGISWQPDASGLGYQTLSRNGAARTQFKRLSLTTGKSQALSKAGDDVFPFRSAWLDERTVLYAGNGGINRQTLDGESSIVPFSAGLTLDRQPYERRRRDHDNVADERALGIVGPIISPDGAQIAFTALGDLWLWSPSTNELSNLTDDPFAEQTPVWSPDGGRIAYIGDKSGPPSLWVYDLNQKLHSRIQISARGISFPSWSPDGRSLAAFTGVPGNPLAGQLVIANLQDGSVTPVLQPTPPQPISWSPDGSYVATTALAPYSSRYREGTYHLRIARPGLATGATAPDSSGSSYDVYPVAHRNITDVALTPFGQAMTYVQSGLLWQQNLDEDFAPRGAPRALTDELADTPSWSSGGEFMVYMNADRMKRLTVATGEIEDITPAAINWRRDQPADEWVLRVGALFDGKREEYRRNVDIAIAGNRIVSINPMDPEVTPAIDASDKSAFPGLFEMHAHMGLTSEPQGRIWLAFGVTSVRDPGSNPYVAKERQEAWNSGRRIGPRTHVTGYLTDGNRVYYSMAEGVTSQEHLERVLDRADRLQLDFIKTYVRLPDHWQKRVVEYAHNIGIPVSSHELYPAVAHGVDHVEHIGGTSRRGYQPKVSSLGYSYDDVVSLLAASGMGITATAVLPGYAVIATQEEDFFETAQFATFYGAAVREAAQTRGRQFASAATATATANGRFLRALIARNALLVTGTDSPFVPYGAGLHAEFRLFERAGLTPYQILQAATVNSAQAAGVADDLGSIEVGKLADIVVVDGDPLNEIRDADNVMFTVKNGRAYTLDTLLSAPE